MSTPGLVALSRLAGVDLTVMSLEELSAWLTGALRLNEWMGGHTPTMPQQAFMLAPQREVLYGGATKGGKSDAMLMAALQYVDVPYYNALILHRTFTDLSKGDALIPRFRDWCEGKKGFKWNEDDHAGIFPSGAKVSFGFVDVPGAERRYKGANYQFIGWEELTEQPDPTPYTYLMGARMARPVGSPIPLRVRATTNPDGPGRPWVKERWGLGHDAAGQPMPRPDIRKRWFIPAKLEDNPHVDRAEIEIALKNLDAVTYAQLREGNWDVESRGDLFKPEMLRLVPMPTSGVVARYRGWDKAGTDAADKRARRAKRTAGGRMSKVDKSQYGVGYIIEHMKLGQWGADKRDRVIREMAGIYRADEALDAREVWEPDPPGTEIFIEQEPGSGGKQSAEISVADLAGRTVTAVLPSGDKESRARSFASQVNAGNVGMVAGPWNAALVAELQAAPNGVYWDQIDALSMIFNKLALLSAPQAPIASAGRARTLAAGYRT